MKNVLQAIKRFVASLRPKTALNLGGGLCHPGNGSMLFYLPRRRDNMLMRDFLRLTKSPY